MLSLAKLPRSPWDGVDVVNARRYWVLFWIAIGMAAHSAIVGRFLGSSFFMLLFFWGWVAAAAYRGKLDSARAMAITMVVLLVSVAAIKALMPAIDNELAYNAFALYPAIVSWICVSLYVRHLMQGESGERRPPPRARAQPLKLRNPAT